MESQTESQPPAGWSVRAWCARQACLLPSTTRCPKSMLPPSVEVGGRRIVIEEPSDWTRRLYAEGKLGLILPNSVQGPHGTVGFIHITQDPHGDWERAVKDEISPTSGGTQSDTSGTQRFLKVNGFDGAVGVILITQERPATWNVNLE